MANSELFRVCIRNVETGMEDEIAELSEQEAKKIVDEYRLNPDYQVAAYKLCPR